MAKPRTGIGKKKKRALIEEAGNKCANPGCFSRRVEIHHIKEWSIYGTNDDKHLIAICPTCHDAVHHGKLKIDDETLYAWKSLPRSATQHDYFGVEPGREAFIEVGQSLRVQSTSGEATVFDISENVYLAFRIDRADFFLLELRLQDRMGKLLMSIEDNRVVHSLPNGFSYERVPGRIMIGTDDSSLYLPEWLEEQVAKVDATHGESRQAFPAKMTVFEMKTIGPSQVRVNGLICDSNAAFLIEKERTYMVTPTGCALLARVGLKVGANCSAVLASPQRRDYLLRNGRSVLVAPGWE
jgi:hypothetical protein